MKEPQELTRNDQNAPNSIIKLSKAFDDVHASKSDPNRPFRSNRTYTVYNSLQADERTTRIDKKLMEIDQNDRNPPNSIIKLSKALMMFIHPNPIQTDRFHHTVPTQYTTHYNQMKESKRNSWWQTNHKKETNTREIAPRSGTQRQSFTQSPLAIQFSGRHEQCSLWEPIQEQRYHNCFVSYFCTRKGLSIQNSTVRSYKVQLNQKTIPQV